MSETTTRWLDQIAVANTAFRARIQPDKLPTARAPGPAVITCMDPRVNLEAIGIPPFSSDGAGASSVRIIRTLGAMADNRSLIAGIFLAGIREIVLLVHTDCGCCLAYSKIDVIVENMQQRLTPDAFEAFRAEIGEPFAAQLRTT
jgi:carbonic anhydrase